MIANEKYSVIAADGCNGWCFCGVALGSVLNLKFSEARSRNDDNVWELDEEGMTMAVPCDGEPYEHEE